MEYCNSKYSLSKQKEIKSVEYPPFKKVQSSREPGPAPACNDFYSKMMANQDLLELMGDSRGSLVRCMKDIVNAKKLILSKQ